MGQGLSSAVLREEYPFYLVRGTLSMFVPVDSVMSKLFVGGVTPESVEAMFECELDLPVRRGGNGGEGV
jgi:hypothetical protein